MYQSSRRTNMYAWALMGLVLLEESPLCRIGPTFSAQSHLVFSTIRECVVFCPDCINGSMVPNTGSDPYSINPSKRTMYMHLWIYFFTACELISPPQKKYDIVETPYNSNCVLLERYDNYASVYCWKKNEPIPKDIEHLVKQ